MIRNGIIPLPEVFNALRYAVRTGNHWRLLPNNLPLWGSFIDPHGGRR